MDLGNSSTDGTDHGDAARLSRLQAMAFGQMEGVIQGFQKVGQCNLFRRSGKSVSPLHTPPAANQLLLAQFLEDVGHESPAESETVRDEASTSSLRMLMQRGEDEDGVVRLPAHQRHPSRSMTAGDE